MNEGSTPEPTSAALEQVLRDELAHGDRALAAARPMLRLLLAADAPPPIDDEIVAHIRGAAFDVARQLLEAEAAAGGLPAGAARNRGEAIAAALFDDASFVAHAHALALEARAAERLRWRGDLDPVLPPLVQDCAADADPERAALAMAVLAAQARFLQYHRRMELPLRDLPGDLFHRALLVLRAHSGVHDAHATETAERRLRDGYDESAGRLALLARLIAGLGEHGGEALAVERAGVSLFVTELAIASGQDRDLALLALGGAQPARLALSLRAAGLGQPDTAAQFAQLQPDGALPDGFEQVVPDLASALLEDA